MVLYQVALGTGLRASELKALKRSCFDLESYPATLTVEAAYSKNRKKSVLPLQSTLVEELKEYFRGKLPSAQALQMPSIGKLASMLRKDLEVSGIQPTDEPGRIIDFHALRHTFITNLARSGVHPKTAQALARHSTITLTMDRCSHVLLEDTAQAIEMLPKVYQVGMTEQATGTYDSIQNRNSRAIKAGKSGAQSGPIFRSKEDKRNQSETNEAAYYESSSFFVNTDENDRSELSKLVAREGIEPSRPCGQGILSPQRLPIPPPGQPEA